MARSRRDDDDDDDDDRPSKRRSSKRDDDEEDEDDDRPAKKKASSRDDDDEDEDERPSKRKARDDDDEDEDYDDRPSKRGKKKKKAKTNMGLIIGLLAGGGLLFVGLAVGAFFLFIFDSPERGFDDIKSGILNKDWGKIYDRLSKEEQAKFEKGVDDKAGGMGMMGADAKKYAGKKGKDLYIAVMKDFEGLLAMMTDKDRENIRNSKVTKVVYDGDTATLTIVNGDGKENTQKMIKQDGRWRMKGSGGLGGL